MSYSRSSKDFALTVSPDYGGIKPSESNRLLGPCVNLQYWGKANWFARVDRLGMHDAAGSIHMSPDDNTLVMSGICH
jgi:hypothetical protein